MVNGEPVGVDEVRAKEILSAEDLEVRVDLGLGSEVAKYWTCDFSYVSYLLLLSFFIMASIESINTTVNRNT